MKRLVPFFLGMAALVLAGLGPGRALPVTAQSGALPDTASIPGVTGAPQSYNLSCESRSAVDWAAYWGIAISEGEFLSRLPRSDNPEAGFVGRPDDAWGYAPPYSYGVHASPVAELLRGYGLQAQAHRGLNWDDLRAEIAAGRPAIVWVIGRMWSGQPLAYTANDGQTTTVARYEHTMILVGYGPDWVQVVDASSGWRQIYSLNSFLASWSVLGNLAVVGQGAPQPTAAPGEGTYVVRPGEYLTALAQRFGVTWQELAALNQIPYPFVIHPGQVLRLPGATPADSPGPTKPAAIAVSPPPSATPMPAQAAEHTYTVQVGDHLRDIAQRLGLDWQELARLNHVPPPYILFPGQLLSLPTPTPQATATPTTTAIPSATPTATPTHTPVTTYLVQPGDYLLAIARRFDQEWRALVKANQISYPYTVRPGQRLVIP